VNRTADLKVLPEWEVGKDAIAIVFPAEISSKVTKAELRFYRPSDSSRDRSFSFTKPDETGKIKVSRIMIGEGHFRIRLLWEMENLSYYKEGVINL
jgi:hypothetical protein